MPFPITVASIELNGGLLFQGDLPSSKDFAFFLHKRDSERLRE